MKKLLKNKKLVGGYILWLTLHLILLLFSWGYPDRYWNGNALNNFWPLSGESFSRSYDYTEFLIYSIVPVMVTAAFNLITSPGQSTNQ